jgi:hypothetical protein
MRGALHQRHRRRWSVAIFLCAFTIRLGLGFATDAFDRRPAGEVANVARALAAGQGFANPNGVASGPTVHVAPLYPLLLSQAIAHIPPRQVPDVVTTLNITIASLVWALLPSVSLALQLPPAVGILGGFIGALSPTNHWTELNGYWGSTSAGLALLIGILATAGFARKPGSMRGGAALGLLWGLILLLQPAALPVLIAVAAVMLGRAPRRVHSLPPLLAMAVLLLLTLTPWTARNYRTMGGLVFVRGNLGVELSVSNNDGARPDHENVLQNPQARHPHVDRVEFERRLAMGEIEYDRARRREAADWIAAHPHRFTALTLQRVWLFWMPQRSHILLTLAQWGLAALAAIGLVLLNRANRSAFLLIAGIWAGYPLLYYIVQTDLRYRYPIEWSIVLAAGVAADEILRRVGRRVTLRLPGLQATNIADSATAT